MKIYVVGTTAHVLIENKKIFNIFGLKEKPLSGAMYMIPKDKRTINYLPYVCYNC